MASHWLSTCPWTPRLQDSNFVVRRRQHAHNPGAHASNANAFAEQHGNPVRGHVRDGRNPVSSRIWPALDLHGSPDPVPTLVVLEHGIARSAGLPAVTSKRARQKDHARDLSLPAARTWPISHSATAIYFHSLRVAPCDSYQGQTRTRSTRACLRQASCTDQGRGLGLALASTLLVRGHGGVGRAGRGQAMIARRRRRVREPQAARVCGSRPRLSRR